MRTVGLALLVLAALAGRAAAQQLPGDPVDEVCDDSIVDPIPLTLRPGGFDAVRSACLRPDIDLRLDAHALVDTPRFYGTLGGDLRFGIRFVEWGKLEWGASIHIVDATFAQTAVLSSTEGSYGPISMHAATATAPTERLRVAGVLLGELPFTRSASDVSVAGAQLAGVASWLAHRWVTVHGRVGLLGWYGRSVGGTTTRGAVVASSDVALRTYSWMHVFGGVEVSTGWFGGGLDHVAARTGLHWRVRGPWRLDVGVQVPFVGDDRTDLTFTLGMRRDR